MKWPETSTSLSPCHPPSSCCLSLTLLLSFLFIWPFSLSLPLELHSSSSALPFLRYSTFLIHLPPLYALLICFSPSLGLLFPFAPVPFTRVCFILFPAHSFLNPLFSHPLNISHALSISSVPSSVPEQVEDKPTISLSLTCSHWQLSLALWTCVIWTTPFVLSCI